MTPRRFPSPLAPALAVVVVVAAGVAVRAPSTSALPYTSAGVSDYAVRPGPGTPPDGIDDDLRPALHEEALTITGPDDEAVIDLWFVRRLPAPSTPPGHPLVNYGTLPEGSLLGVMRLHREHRDFRDQSVPPGVYAVRYLRQPVDGKHLGETTYRDFAVLVPAPTASSPEPQRFDVTLGQALQLNTHPFVWGLWPADYVMAAEQPGIASIDGDKWAIKLQLPRADGGSQPLALVVVGNERHYY